MTTREKARQTDAIRDAAPALLKALRATLPLVARTAQESELPILEAARAAIRAADGGR